MPPLHPSTLDRAAVTRRPPARFPALALALLGALGLAAPQRARADAMWLRWSGCALEGLPAQAQSCGSLPTERDLDIAIATDTSIAHVVGAVFVVDVITDAPSVPDWWRFDPGGCRAGALSADTQVAPASACLDGWSGAGVALVQGVQVPRPGGAPSELRLLVTASLPPTQEVTLDPGPTYHLGRLILPTAIHGASGTCAGCDVGACLVLNSVQLIRAPSAQEPDVTLVSPAASNGNFALWQTGAGCAAVPARARTWGQIKALYR